MGERGDAEPARPGPIWRALAGAFHVPAGIAFLLGTLKFWPLAAYPAGLTAILLLLGLLGGLFAVPFADDLITPQGEERGVSALLLAAAVWAGLPIAGLLLGLALALLLASPILERLSWAVERHVRGEAIDARQGGFVWEASQALRGALYFAARTPGVFLVSLVPFVGPALGALWGAHALAFQMTEPPLQRQGLDFWARRMWHRRYRAESLGFGLAALVILFLPLVEPAARACAGRGRDAARPGAPRAKAALTTRRPRC